MSSSKSVVKAARVGERARLQNRSIRSRMKTRVTRVEKLIGSGEEELQRATVLAVSSVDRAVKRGVIHKNKAARIKSRLTKKVNAGQTGK